MSIKNIVLIGMPGSGKTTIGFELSKKLRIPFYDTDEIVKKISNKTINEIFDNGEDIFRSYEKQALKISLLNPPSVISTGGGIIKDKNNVNLMKVNSIIIYIDRDINKIKDNIDINSRPLLKNDISFINELYNQRNFLYNKYMDYKIYNNGEVNITVQEILNIYSIS